MRSAGRAAGARRVRRPVHDLGTPEYCCPSPSSCNPTKYSKYFKSQCPQSFSYPYDDNSATFACPGNTNYQIVYGATSENGGNSGEDGNCSDGKILVVAAAIVITIVVVMALGMAVVIIMMMTASSRTTALVVVAEATMAARRPRVAFCGYSIPHPSDNKVNIRVQTTAKDVLKDGLQDLMVMCQHVTTTFENAVAEFRVKQEQQSGK
uniref:DNA-directed RNA polymerase RBP11-like dimerisation domain-containing protein n=1 Tax=Ananas comosus var. bracteatus TaxID=296719 RepID=A0A6V7NM73_ANACO|nr:unnamed protein product [Ananas comosus var. bracteatus]